MSIKKVFHFILFVAAIGISIFLLFFVITCTWIGYEVKTQCTDAKREYLPARLDPLRIAPSETGSAKQGGRQASQFDCVEALIMLLNDDHRGFRARNDAIWVLGQLGDARALPVLESYYTGDIPEREPLDAMISQYELKKAIHLTSGGVNLSAIIWRNTNFDTIKK